MWPSGRTMTTPPASSTEIALTFADYLDPRIKGETEWDRRKYPAVTQFMERIEDATGIPVTMVGTGPHSVIDT